MDKIGLHGDQLRDYAAKHLLDGEGVHLPNTYPGFGLRFANEADLVGEGAMP